MIQIKNSEVFSTTGKPVHRLGTESYFSRSTVLPSETEADFEEVETIPTYTRAQYEEKVAELVRMRYTESEEFALQRKAINAAFSTSLISSESEKALSEYAVYNSFVEQCKEKAKNPELYDSQHD